jgi:hypothetical protein
MCTRLCKDLSPPLDRIIHGYTFSENPQQILRYHYILALYLGFHTGINISCDILTVNLSTQWERYVVVFSAPYTNFLYVVATGDDIYFSPLTVWPSWFCAPTLDSAPEYIFYICPTLITSLLLSIHPTPMPSVKKEEWRTHLEILNQTLWKDWGMVRSSLVRRDINAALAFPCASMIILRLITNPLFIQQSTHPLIN